MCVVLCVLCWLSFVCLVVLFSFVFCMLYDWLFLSGLVGVFLFLFDGFVFGVCWLVFVCVVCVFLFGCVFDFFLLLLMCLL